MTWKKYTLNSSSSLNKGGAIENILHHLYIKLME